MARRRLSAPIPIALAAVAVGLTAWAAGPQPLSAQPRNPSALQVPAQAPAQDPRDPEFVSLERACILCHREKPPNFDDDLVRFSEITLWKAGDPHFHAYKNILDEADAMSKRLGYDVSTDARCTNCHAPGYHSDKLAVVTPEKIAEEGVTCVTCHGAYASWIKEHGTATNSDWRTFDASKKEAEFGMTDLRSAPRRADVCTSCHVGDASAGKVVTHEMYAAGHPPLPSFDLATFSEGLSPHWREPKDVPFLQQSDAEARRKYHYDPDELLRPKLAVFGALANLSATMGTFVAEMAARSEGGWPDFARFDCYACHHDLKIAGWRPSRGFSGTPGRVPAPTWPFAIVDLAIEAAADDAESAKAIRSEYDRLHDELRLAVDAAPFGDPSPAEAAAKALDDWSERLTDRLKSKEEAETLFDRETSLRLLNRITELAGGTPDYESARQLAWVFRDLFRALADESYGGEDPAELQRLAKLLKLDLVRADTPDWSVNGILEPRMEAVNDYDPAVFLEAFRRVSGLIPES